MGSPTRQDGRVESGQKISTAFSARAWNRAQDAADIVLGEQSRFVAGPQAGRELASNIVLIRNGSGCDVPWLGVLGIGGVVINPGNGTLDGTDEASDRARTFASRPVLAGVVPVRPDHLRRFVVAMEPIAIGAIGRAAIGGAFACRVNVSSLAHEYATIKDGDVTQLQSASCGPIMLAWVSGTGDSKWACGVC